MHHYLMDEFFFDKQMLTTEIFLCSKIHFQKRLLKSFRGASLTYALFIVKNSTTIWSHHLLLSCLSQVFFVCIYSVFSYGQLKNDRHHHHNKVVLFFCSGMCLCCFLFLLLPNRGFFFLVLLNLYLWLNHNKNKNEEVEKEKHY